MHALIFKLFSQNCPVCTVDLTTFLIYTLECYLYSLVINVMLFTITISQPNLCTVYLGFFLLESLHSCFQDAYSLWGFPLVCVGPPQT